MDNPKVAVIVLNWNGKDDTLECLASIGKIDYSNLDVILVDNGSFDGSVAAIHRKYPEVAIVETGSNLGFAGGNNMGIRYALRHGAEYILVLNNDTIVDSQLIKSFLASSTVDLKAGIFGAKIYYYYEPNKIWHAGGQWVSKSSNCIHVGMGRIDNEKDFNSIVETDYICGCALFIRAEVFSKIGLFDEMFFLMFEETDLCYRARRAGFKCLFVPKAKIWHKISVSFGGEESGTYCYFMMRNKLLWAEKNLPIGGRLVLYRHALGELFRCVTPPRMSWNSNGKGLSYETVSQWLIKYKETLVKKYRKPANKAKLLGARDYVLRRFGNCPNSVRSLGK
jgi:GT2 family glycosyltransferase